MNEELSFMRQPIRANNVLLKLSKNSSQSEIIKMSFIASILGGMIYHLIIKVNDQGFLSLKNLESALIFLGLAFLIAISWPSKS